MIDEVVLALWFFLPAGIANVVPIFAAHIAFLARFTAPIDMGRTWRGRRVLGDHKTWRGLISGIIAATIVLGLQQILVIKFGWFDSFTDRVDYASLPTLIVGPLFAFGALGGDALKSFFKRQIGVAPGKSWFPFDQIDYIIGGAIATFPFVHFALAQYVWIGFIWLVIHVASTTIGYLLGLKDQPI